MPEGIPIPVPDEGEPGVTAPFIPSPPHPPVTEPGEGPITEPAPGPNPIPVPPLKTNPQALPDLGLLALILFALGLMAVAAAFSDFLNWLTRTVLGSVGLGKKAPQIPTEVMTQALGNALGKPYTGADAPAGIGFHKLAALLNQQLDAMVAGGHIGQQTAAKVVGVQQHAAAQDKQAGAATQLAKGAQQAADNAAAKAATAAATAKASEGSLSQRIHALEHYRTVLLEPELDALKSAIPDLQKGATTTWDLLRKHEEALGIGAITAGTAVALAQLGGSWIRCESNQAIGSALCGPTGNGLSRLLKGALPLLAFADVCDTLKAASALVNSGPVRGSISLGADGISGLMHCAHAEGAGPLDTLYFAPGQLTSRGAPGAVTSAT